MRISFAILTGFLIVFPLRAEDWTTLDGKIYANVKVLKEEPDAVTILYKEGGALIPLAQLPPELQARFHYDPAKAQAAAAARAKADAQSKAALGTEKTQADKLKQAQIARDEAAQADLASPSSPASEPAVLEPNQHQQDILGPKKK